MGRVTPRVVCVSAALLTSVVQPDIEAGFVFTVEPGIYFNDALMFPAFDDPAFAPYIAEGLIRPLLEARFGGVRIEDDILVTEDGYENLSLAPKTVEEIENLMSS